MRRFGLILITYIIIAVAAVAWAQVDDGLIAYWSFDACNFQDQSGNGFDNGVAPAQAPECLPGAAGNALEFADTDAHYLRIPDVPVAPTQHSYAFWFRPATTLDDSSPRQDLLYADVPVVVSGNGRPHITLNHDNDGKIGFHARIIPTGGGIDDAIPYDDIKSDTNAWEANRWYHVAFTWDGEDGRFRVYVDGDLQQTITNRSGTSQTYTGLVFAIRGDLKHRFQGSLDEVRMYDRVLSDAEVQTLATFAPGPSFELTVLTDGTGTGTVFSTPTAGIACGAADTDCTQSYISGTSVTLTAVATPDSVFDGWSGGGCSGTGPCTVTIDQAQDVTATFVPGPTLSVAVVGDGAVTSNPAGIDCGATCSAGFSTGTEVTLTATPVTGANFTEWNGGGCEVAGTSPCTVTMNANNAVTATFNTSGLFPLNVTNTLGTGTGTVTSSPEGIDCGVDCDEPYPSGTQVTLTPTPGVDSFFFQWGGDCSGTEPPTDPCTLTMDQAHSVHAVFALIQTRLTVVKSGTGSGTVRSDPPGINCGLDCGNNYNVNTVVTLTATPADADTALTGWIGGGCSGIETCVVTMTEDLTVTATFERLSTLTVIKAGDGDGSVVSDLPGINCGEDCSEVYTGETVITLTATPAADSVFTGWSDPDCPATDPCVITLPEGRDITATFENPPLANAGVDQTVDEGILVTLDGSQSTDFSALSYSWVQTSGAPVTLSDASAAQPTFTSPSVDANGAVLVFELTVTDSSGLSATDSVQVTVLDTNIPPMADAGPDQLVEENVQVTLNGTNSSDSDGSIESFVWLQMAGPPVSLSDPTSPQPVFTAPIVSLAAGFLPGDTLPGFVLQQRAAGSIADVAARGVYVNGQWTVMFTRTLTTLDPDADVQFDLNNAANLYAFSVAYLDNTGAAPPRSAAAAVMATQDTTPYTLGNTTSGADLQARRETPLDCSAFTGTPLVTAPADPAVVPSLTLQAAYDDVNLYLCMRTPDPNGIADERPEHWEFLGPESTDWERKPNAVNVMGGTPNAFDEDRIALWWNINAQDFATEGCFALCHDQRMQSRNPDGRADLWHWKAGTTNLAGLAQDQGLSADPALCPEHPCRQSDSAAEVIAQPNVRWVDTLMLPAFIAADDPGVNARTLFADAVPADCFDCAFAQSTMFNDMLEFELTVTDDDGLSASDRVTVQIMETPPPPTPSGGGGGGGGCAMMPGARVDPTLLAALFLMLAYLGWRRTRRV